MAPERCQVCGGVIGATEDEEGCLCWGPAQIEEEEAEED